MGDYPFPNTGVYVLERYELHIVVIWKTNNDSRELQVIRREIEKLRPTPVRKPLSTPQMIAQVSVPNKIAFTDTNTVVTATSTNSKVAE